MKYKNRSKNSVICKYYNYVKRSVISVLFIFSIILNAHSSYAEETITSGGEYFVKGLTEAIHSIAFDNMGMMYVGSLGEAENEIRKTNKKNIYKISPDKKIELFTSVECTYITGLSFDYENNLFVLTSTIDPANKKEIGGIVKVNAQRDAMQVVTGITPVYAVSFDEEGNLYYLQDNKSFILLAADYRIALVSETPYIRAFNSKPVYEKEYGGDSIKKVIKSETDSILSSETIVSNLPFSKDMAIDEENSIIYLVVWDEIDFLLTLTTDGEMVSKKRLDISADFSPKHVSGNKKHVLNQIAIGSEPFGKDYIYGVTWSGDIIRIRR